MKNKDTGEKQRYLILGGVISSDQHLELQPCYVVDFGTNGFRGTYAEPTANEILTVTMVDGKGQILMREQIALHPVCYYRNKRKDHLFAARLAYAEQTARVNFYYLGKLIHELKVSEKAPLVENHWTPPETVTGTHRISWKAISSTDHRPYSMVFISNITTDVWEPLSLSLPTNELDVDFDSLPGGKYKIKIIATAGVNTGSVETVPFNIPAKGFRAMILSPGKEITLKENTPFLFQGQGLEMEEDRPELDELVWTSSIDGEIGKGNLIEAVLSKGSHTITLHAGKGKKSGEESVSVSVI